MRKIVIHNHLPRRARDENAWEHALSKEQEEKNRDKAYRDSGIVRVLASDAMHPDYAKVKHIASVKAAAQKLREAYGKGPDHVAAEKEFNQAVEKALSPSNRDVGAYRANDKRARRRK
jgi:hypothetical protein